MEKRNIRLAIQKGGRLSEKSLGLLRSCGLEIENYSNRLIVTAKNYELDILFLRDDDIPEYVQDGVADIGIVGQNVAAEKGVEIEYVKELGFSKCQLMIAIPQDYELSDISGLNGKTIATSYPNILKKYLSENNIVAKVIEISGSVEIAPSLGIADFICDIVSTGNTLKGNKLKKSFVVFNSEAVLIGNKAITENPEIQSILNDILGRMDSTIAAKGLKYLMMNVPKTNLDTITEIIPSVKSPSILPLATEDEVAVHTVIQKDKFWAIINDLKSNGATGILLLPIENMIS